MSTSKPLPSLFADALRAGSKATAIASADDETQELVRSAASDLQTLLARINSLALFSANETLEDVSTKDLVYFFVPYVYAEILGRRRTKGRDERLEVVRQAGNHTQGFVRQLEQYEIIPPDEVNLFKKTGAFASSDAATRREVKIKQYQKEKEIRGKIGAIRARRHPSKSDEEPSNDLELILSLLPNATPTSTSTTRLVDEDDEDEDEDDVRAATLLLLRLTWAQANAALENLKLELELLRSAPPDNDQNTESPGEGAEDATWKLDTRRATGGPDGHGPLLDAKGKPLRPFTIVPAAINRARLQAEVFRPDHRLPTMTIDDYLAEEQRRGNILTGGGAASGEGPTTSEQLAIDAEADGTVAGWDKDEEKRQKDEKWAVFTDANPKGAGNTMNKG